MADLEAVASSQLPISSISPGCFIALLEDIAKEVDGFFERCDKRIYLGGGVVEI